MPTTTDVDVLIIGAGISGLGAAASLTMRRPGTSFVVVEARDEIGGTWDLFRYPGVRSDSDLYTFGYDFKPWREERSIASGDQIMAYLRETVQDHDLAGRIRLGHRVVSSDWDSGPALWTTVVQRAGSEEREQITSRWIFSACGYFRYDEGFTPDLPRITEFQGEVVHPQQWPEDLDHAGRRVLIIGSGATAVTLLPALAQQAEHVVMLQRTPSYILSPSSRDGVALRLRRLLGDRRAHPLIRRKNIATQRLIWTVSRRRPELMRRFIRWTNTKQLPEGYPVERDFTPPYEPWDQRLCLVPDGDFFAAIRGGRASVVTDHIRTFTPSGVVLRSGAVIEADVVVTATGLNIQPLGGVEISVGGEPVDIAARVSFKGMMLSGIPNFAYAVGYTNASWTLKVGLLCEHFCRLLEHMGSGGFHACTPVAPVGIATRPLLDFDAGYVRRAVDDLPRQGDRAPWATSADYRADVKLLRHGPVDDPALRFEVAAVAPGGDPAGAAG